MPPVYRYRIRGETQQPLPDGLSPLNASIRTSDKELLGKAFTKTGRTEVKLERRYKTIRDVMTGDVLGKDTDSLVLSSSGPRIWLLETID